MTEDAGTSTRGCRDRSVTHTAGISSGVYGLAFVGAVVYFLQQAGSFWEGVLGVLKAIVWPALLIYKLLEFLGM